MVAAFHIDEALDEVEAEDVAFQDIDNPWDPDTISVRTNSFSLRNMLDLIAEKGLDLAPDFQRHEVWGHRQRAQLIESILLQIPLPAFYFAEDAEGVMQVVDGLQRLSTINDFVVGGPDKQGGFQLSGLEYLADVQGKRFVELPPVWKRRIYNTQIIAHVIAPSTPPVVMYDIFRRINTGGSPLTAQEIRHCMSRTRSRTFLKELAATTAFERATGGVLKNHRRMIDRELALRFVAFWHRGPEAYSRDDTLDSFLLETTRQIDDAEVISDDALIRIKEKFELGLDLAYEIFGRHAFRKWAIGDDRLLPINRALFETWTVELARIGRDSLQGDEEKIATAARTGMATDHQYIASISAGTSDLRSVHTRFEKTRGFIELDSPG